MVTFGLNYDVKPPHRRQFERTCQEVIAAMRAMSGHVETRLYGDLSRPNSYLVYSQWDSPEAFAAFMRSEAFKAAQRFGREILDGPPRHHVYTELRGPARPAAQTPTARGEPRVADE